MLGLGSVTQEHDTGGRGYCSAQQAYLLALPGERRKNTKTLANTKVVRGKKATNCGRGSAEGGFSGAQDN